MSVVIGFQDGTILLWSRHTNQHLVGFKGHPGGITSLVFSPDSRTIASGGYDGTILLWELR